MAEQQQRVPNLLDDKKLALYGKKTEGSRGAPKMQFSVYKGNPAIIVFPNDPNDTDKKPIRAAMDMINWPVFTNAIRAMAEATEAGEYRIVNKRGAPGKVFTDSTTIVGRTSEGIVYIGLIKEGRPAKRFPVQPSMYMALVDSEGNDLDAPTVSKMMARGLADQLDAHIFPMMRETYEPPQNPNQQGGGQRNNNSGGGGNAGGGGGGGASDWDDLPL